MYAIIDKRVECLVFLVDTGQYLIFDTEENANKFFLNKVEIEDISQYEVRDINWIDS